MLQLDEENQKKFNEKQAIEFFKKMEGKPYGFETFMFGWIDTEY